MIHQLVTSRLVLLPASPEQVRAIIAGEYVQASKLVGAHIPIGWPFNREAQQVLPWHLSALERDANQQLWRIRFIINAATEALIGSVNLKGPPTERGDIEIGWGLVPEARGRGFATEASKAVIEWAFRMREVRRVTATIPEDNAASQKVARRLGMAPSGEVRRSLPLWAIDRT